MNLGWSARVAMLALAGLTLALSAVGSRANHTAQAQPLPTTPLTAEALRAGGYVIFLRHGLADQGQDAGSVKLDDCGTQRNLNEVGMRDARLIGDAVRALQIPLDRVFSSEYCRAMETALIAFRSAERTPLLNFCCADGLVPTNDERMAWLNQALATPPPPGTNTMLVGHGVYIVTDAAQGEALVYQPDGRGGTTRVARILPAEWLLATYPNGGAR